MLNIKREKEKKNAYSQERNVNWTVTKLSVLGDVLQFTYVWIYKQHHNVYLKATLGLIKWAPRRAQISLDLCCSQVDFEILIQGFWFLIMSREILQ